MVYLTIRDLPRSLKIKGRDYPLKSDFRTWIIIESIILDKNIPDRFKLGIALQYAGIDYEGPQDDLWEPFLFFLNGGKQPKKDKEKDEETAFLFDYDIGLIYSAFRQQYGINILKENMHWFEFLWLLQGLTNATQFVKVVGYRTMDTSGLKGKEKSNAEKVKNYYAIRTEYVKEKTP